MSKFNGVKTNNARTSAKKILREFALSGVRSPKVIEVFCGAGKMYNEVWRKADEYIGIDKVKFFDERKTICGDARKAIRQIDLSRYNIFDIDAYGSPYIILSEIIDRIEVDDRCAFVVTDGSAMDLKMGRVSSGLRALTGIEPHIIKRAHIIQDELIVCVIKKVAEKLKCDVDGVRIARGKTGSQMRYFSFIIKRRDAAQSSAGCDSPQGDNIANLP